MKANLFRLLGVVMLLIAAPAFSGQAMQMWSCGLEDDVTEATSEISVLAAVLSNVLHRCS